MHRVFHRVLLFQFLQILSHGVMDLRCFSQLLAWDAALLGRIGFHEAAIHRQVPALHQSHFHTLAHDLFKQLLEQLRFLKPPMTVLGESRVMRDLLIETQTGEPAPGQVHAQFFHQLALAADAVGGKLRSGRMRSRSSGSIDGRPVSL